MAGDRLIIHLGVTAPANPHDALTANGRKALTEVYSQGHAENGLAAMPESLKGSGRYGDST